MVFEDPKLSPEHLELARELWEALNDAPSPEALEEARARLILAPEQVRSSILRANIVKWQQGDRRGVNRRQGEGGKTIFRPTLKRHRLELRTFSSSS